jgi:hypothetical protein
MPAEWLIPQPTAELKIGNGINCNVICSAHLQITFAFSQLAQQHNISAV